jgi:hypothetical protein
VRRFRERMQDLMTLLAPLGADRLRDGGGGADIGLLGQGGVQLLGLAVEGSRYFDIHHTAADTFDKVAKEDIDRVAAVLAITAFAIADAPVRIDVRLSAPTEPAPRRGRPVRHAESPRARDACRVHVLRERSVPSTKTATRLNDDHSN